MLVLLSSLFLYYWTQYNFLHWRHKFASGKFTLLLPNCYCQLWPLRPACSWSGPDCMPDPTSCIQLGSVFPKKAQIRLRKSDPDRSWTALSSFGQTHLVWKQARVQESSGLVSRKRLSCILPQAAQIILCKTSPDLIRFRLTRSGLGHMNLVWKQDSVQESSGPFLSNASEPSQIRSGMVTGCLQLELCQENTWLFWVVMTAHLHFYFSLYSHVSKMWNKNEKWNKKEKRKIGNSHVS